MTQQKKLKRAIRARSRKTGESYTAARRHVLQARRKPAAPSASPTVALPRGPKVLSRRGEGGLIKKTGHGYDHWFAVLDTFGAPAKGHTASAAHLSGRHGVPGWHAQMITVAYERERGLRAMYQSSAGDFQVTVSKAVPAPVADVVEVFRIPRRRAAWLKAADPALARAFDAAFAGDKPREVKVKGDSQAWLRYPWDGTTVEIRITGKPNGGSTIAVGNMKLARPAQVEERRAQWRGALEGLKGYLTS